MALTAFALGMFLSSAALGMESAPAAPGRQASLSSDVDRFEGRPQARIPFSRQVQNFQVKRESNFDVLYLETTRSRWYRGPISCFGISDPRDAQGIVPIDRGFGIDNFTRFVLLGFSHERNECSLNSLVELTPEEAVELGLVRNRTARTKSTPQ